MNEMGRHSEYTEAKADLICERLGNGESLRRICKDRDMPPVGTVCRWLLDPINQHFREQYALAREIQADTLFDEVLDISDDGSNDWMERHAKDNRGWVENGEAMRRSELRVNTRKWIAGKLRPKKYGEPRAGFTPDENDKPPAIHVHFPEPKKE